MRKVFETVASAQATGDEPEIVISTAAPDRENDEVIPEGCDLDSYLRNPIVQFGHAYSALPIGSTTRIEIVPRGIKARWRWLGGDEFAERVKNAYDQGVLRAASIGFRPLDSEPNGYGGRRYTRWQLLEWSLVPVPANPEAVRTLKRLGLTRGYDEPRYGYDDLSCGDEIALRLLADEPTVSHGDVAAALRDVLPEAIGSEFARLIGREVARAISRSRGRVDDDPFSDPFVPRITRHREQVFDIDRTTVAQICRELVPTLITRDSVAAAVHAALARSRGRVD